MSEGYIINVECVGGHVYPHVTQQPSRDHGESIAKVQSGDGVGDCRLRPGLMTCVYVHLMCGRDGEECPSVLKHVAVT